MQTGVVSVLAASLSLCSYAPHSVDWRGGVVNLVLLLSFIPSGIYIHSSLFWEVPSSLKKFDRDISFRAVAVSFQRLSLTVDLCICFCLVQEKAPLMISYDFLKPIDVFTDVSRGDLITLCLRLGSSLFFLVISHGLAHLTWFAHINY